MHEASVKNHDGNKRVDFYLSDEGEEYIIEIADQGIGFPEGEKNEWFKKGITTKNSETHENHSYGMGLYLVSSYLKRCKGVMIIEDNDPCGALFLIYIPKNQQMHA